MLVNKTSYKFTGKLGQKVDKTKCGHNYKIILYSGLYLWKEQEFKIVEEVWPSLKMKNNKTEVTSVKLVLFKSV